ncbi:TRAP-type C4-dicarboxylate transport system permease small subunit [Cryobacterium mesophilum]|uniref:Heme exporter protein D n=1 Tax=Terrimesophilobacter mesophilus TaxID=433647 RepID=A0A4R8VE70_9MICO|nr:hypothetical protein [Terrimesophilobacter mesophilus]MBB5633772.1 TRAP-type C4-dicarboxylate transport system permease small subunit [Terrimesophilobacter mesophilus]TFB80452.1 hypothetical protein E3N84_10675 [Terrimesophilobacter mesophilus]
MNPTPTPTLPADFNLDTVTPGWIGFAITFLVVLVTVFLIMDMVRRIRRVRYRAEVREKLEEERRADDLPGS